jgi:hypothetical protein
LSSMLMFRFWLVGTVCGRGLLGPRPRPAGF